MSILKNSFSTFWKGIKQLVTGTETFTLLQADWQHEEAEEGEQLSEFPYYVDFAAANVTASDIVTCMLDIDSVNAAEQSGIYARPESLDGAIRFRARIIPAANISGRYWLGRKLTA